MIDRILVDTNIIIYCLQGLPHVVDLLEDQRLAISFITEIELYPWPRIAKADQALIQKFVEDCELIEYNSKIKSRVIALRGKYNLKMSDPFIASTALEYDLPLVSSDQVFSNSRHSFLKC